MDTLSGLLESPKARGAFLLKSVFNPPWGLRIEDRAPLSVVTMLQGSAWVLREGAAPVRMAAGDVAVLRGPEPYTLADDPSTPPGITVDPDQRCSTTDGEDVTEAMSLGVRTWGEPRRTGSTVMLSGTYQAPNEVGRRLLASLPALLVQPASAARTPLIGMLAAEMDNEDICQEVVLDRLLDLLLINVLRAWLMEPGTGAPLWFRAQSDPVVGRALRLLHERPGESWTVASLAASVGVSRAALARNFTELVGEPPMSYLTGWRLTLAADLLRDLDMSVAKIAQQVGYSGPFALSAAFKRERGVSPQEFRRGERSEETMATGSDGRTVVLRC
ncbi:AraC family transcriptional regulator [Streptomyces hygroscopicus subsp. sporocinereus]|uniref:AraC family transcriptional regulator n=1 Tax=Streptomyces hygroscopicus TaxID=1912 RepID=A0ABQ3U2U5_STRHY|nr:AraC family transcriptional regulator [Streptomyces hygroscopicus]GHJ29929.1 AraC family transcriptional regulator [Streptomyces hygroscopicus]